MPRRSPRPRQALLTITLVPQKLTTSQAWKYTLPSGRSGVIIGDLDWSGRYCFSLARSWGRRGVQLRFPKAQWVGLQPQVIVLASIDDIHLLRAVDVAAMASRHGVECRGSVQRSSWRERIAEVVAILVERMPVVWPAVP